jgi:hypothetical protein
MFGLNCRPSRRKGYLDEAKTGRLLALLGDSVRLFWGIWDEIFAATLSFLTSYLYE